MSIIAYDFGVGDSIEVAVKSLKNCVHDICSRPNNQKPHFLISPYGDLYSNTCI